MSHIDNYFLLMHLLHKNQMNTENNSVVIPGKIAYVTEFITGEQLLFKMRPVGGPLCSDSIPYMGK